MDKYLKTSSQISPGRLPDQLGEGDRWGLLSMSVGLRSKPLSKSKKGNYEVIESAGQPEITFCGKKGKTMRTLRTWNKVLR